MRLATIIDGHPTPAVVGPRGVAPVAELGDFADEGVLAGPRAYPRVLLDHGYTFRDGTLQQIVGAALGRA